MITSNFFKRKRKKERNGKREGRKKSLEVRIILFLGTTQIKELILSDACGQP